MKIIHQKLGVDFKTEAIGIYLLQILSDIDDITKRLKNPDAKWKIIKSILELISSSGRPFNFVIFPEIAIPYKYIRNLINFIKEKFPDKIVAILGIEIISVKDCETIVNELKIQDKETNKILQNANKNRLVNPCLIMVKSKKNKCQYFLQLKITHSKYEGTLDNIENLLPGEFIYYFESKNINFTTLICSDFFNRPSGFLTRIIDQIDYEILKNGLPLDFIINIQYNPSPDHELFLHSLNRLYDDGYKSHGNLCTIFLNSILPGIRKGGLSKVIFYKDLKLPEKQPLKQIDAPVVGYEFSESEMLVYLSFERLPKSWDPKRDIYPLHFECHKLVGEKWLSSKEEHIHYIAPVEKETFLGYETYEELAYGLSNLGKFDKSIEWAEKAQRYWENQKNYFKAASSALFTAIQYRHQGEFLDSLKNYALAERLVLEIKNLTLESKIIIWRIKAGRIMVEDYLVKGDCRGAYKKYDELVKEIDSYLKNHQIDNSYKGKIELYKIHVLRQQAEMLRLLGRYSEAFIYFHKAYKQYNYIYAEEKAYSILGQGDCLRMLGKFDDATIKYKEVETFAQEKRNKRLLLRVLRNMAEIYRKRGQEIENFLDEIIELSNEINYLFGKIYYFLIGGGVYLMKDIEKAEEFFNQARSLVQIDGNYIKIEHAHSIFGLAETKRLRGDKKAAIDYYKQAHKLYEEMGILWGIIRTSIGIYMTDSSNSELKISIKNFKTRDPIDKDFIIRLSQNRINPNEILFLNIP